METHWLSDKEEVPGAAVNKGNADGVVYSYTDSCRIHITQ